MSKRTLEEIGERLMQTVIEREELQKLEPRQLIIWSDKKAAAPNELTRSALFHAGRPQPDKLLREVCIASQGDTKIFYTGPVLDQSHYDVFMGVMHLTRGARSGSVVRFSAYKLLKLIGRSTSGADYRWLFSTFQSLTATSVAIVKEGAKEYWGSLLPQGTGDPDSAEYCVLLSPQLVSLFERGLTYVEWEQRRKLMRKPLAQWLQMYYLSHSEPYPVRVETIREMCGSKSKQIYKFRDKLRIALDEVKNAGVIQSWTIDDDDLVHVSKGR